MFCPCMNSEHNSAKTRSLRSESCCAYMHDEVVESSYDCNALHFLEYTVLVLIHGSGLSTVLG